MMIPFMTLLLAIGYGLVQWHVSVWRLKARLDARSRPLTDPEMVAHCVQLAKALGIEQVQVGVLDDPTINGLAAPDGRIFLTDGFVQAHRKGEVTAAELASVVAHELGHVALGHSRRRMIDFTGQNALLTIARPILHRVLPGVGAMLAGFLTRMLAAGLSRRDEHEADEYASALLIKAGIGTDAQKSLFGKLDRLDGQKGNVPMWLQSHPPTPQRIARIEARESDWR